MLVNKDNPTRIDFEVKYGPKTWKKNGQRVKKVAVGVTTLYLVDELNPSGYAQVLEELTVSGGTTNLTRAYTYGPGLISLRQPGRGSGPCGEV